VRPSSGVRVATPNSPSKASGECRSQIWVRWQILGCLVPSPPMRWPAQRETWRTIAVHALSGYSWSPSMGSRFLKRSRPTEECNILHVLVMGGGRLCANGTRRNECRGGRASAMVRLSSTLLLVSSSSSSSSGRWLQGGNVGECRQAARLTCRASSRGSETEP
jgi:hypothetical protein